MRAVGLGCHSDHLYVDLRPLIPGHEREYVTVWEAENTTYCGHVMNLRRDMILGKLVKRVVYCTICIMYYVTIIIIYSLFPTIFCSRVMLVKQISL